MIPQQFQVVGENGEIASVGFPWLRARVKSAANRSGLGGCWIIENIAFGLAAFLGSQTCSPFAVEELEERVKGVIRTIGYPEVAHSLQLRHPCQKASLLDCTKIEHELNEVDFFTNLRGLIELFHGQGVHALQLLDLAACEAALLTAQGSFGWDRSTNCRAKIVRFVRAELRRLPWPQCLRCSIL